MSLLLVGGSKTITSDKKETTACDYEFLTLELRMIVCIIYTRAIEMDKCKLVQPFHRQSAISVSFTQTADRPFPRSRKLPIGSFRNDWPFPNIR